MSRLTVGEMELGAEPAALSRITTGETELEALRSKLAIMGVEMRDVTEKSKVVAFEEVEAIYLEQVEQIKALVFKRGYDVRLGDDGVPEDSPL